MNGQMWVKSCWRLAPLLAALGCNSGSDSNGNTGTPLDTSPPSDVTGFVAVPGLLSAALEWTPASDDTAIGGYKITQLSPPVVPGSGSPSTLIVPANVLSVVWDSLAGGVQHTFSIVAIDSSNNFSQAVATVAVTPVVPDVTPPEDASDLSGGGGLNGAGNVEIRLTWTPSPDADVSHYLLCLGLQDGVCDVLNNFNVGNLTAVTIPDAGGPIQSDDLLQPLVIDTDYFVQVITIDASGNQSRGIRATVTPTQSQDNTAPEAVRNLTAKPSNQSVTLAWEEPLPLGDANQFSVYFRDFGDDAGRETVGWTLFETTSSNSSTVTGLANGVVFEFMIAGIDDAGNETSGALTAATSDDEASKITGIPTSNLIQASPNIAGGVFRIENFGPGRDVIVTVRTTVDGLLSADASTRLFYTLDGTEIDTTITAETQTAGIVSFGDAGRVTEVVPGRLYTVRIDFDPSVAGAQRVSENVSHPNGSADHIVFRYLVRAPTDASRVFEDDYLIYQDHAANAFFKFSGERNIRGYPTLTVLRGGLTEGDLVVTGGTSSAFGLTSSLDTASRYRVQFEHFEDFRVVGLSRTMNVDRTFHRASLLASDNQSILISGGFNDDGLSNPTDGAGNESLSLLTTEIFRGNPANEGFEAAPQAMDRARSFHTSTRLYDGRVLLLGGLNGETNIRGSIAQPETVVPTPGQNEAKPTLLSFNPSTLGGVLGNLVGGIIEKLSNNRVIEVGVVTKSAPNTQDTTLQDLTIAGFALDNVPGDLFRIINGPTDTAEFFNLDGTNGPAVGDTMAESRFGHTATLLSDGTVFIAGGIFDYDSDDVNPRSDGVNEFATEIYDPQFDRFVSLGLAAELPDSRLFHTSTLLRDGKVLICGGLERGDPMFRSTGFANDPAVEVRRSAILFDPFNRTTSTVGNMVSPRFFHAATLLPTGEVLIIGGFTDLGTSGVRTVTKTAEIYDPVTRTFRATTGNLNTFRGPCAAELIPIVDNSKLGGKVLVVSGSQNTLAEIFDPSTGRFSATAHGMASDRYLGASHALLRDGRVVITGGQETTLFEQAGEFHDSIEVYDTSTVKFTPSPVRMSVARRHHQATLLLDGTVLVTGGENESGGLDQCETWDPDEETVTSAARMVRKRYKHTATRLADGKVFVAGGASTIGPLSSCEIYDPATRSFASASSMSIGRFDHTATLLANGWVLITGGESIDDTSIEIFDPVMGDFLAAPNVSNMLAGRDGHSATRPAYTIGRARFTNGSANVIGSDAGTNPFGFESTNWLSGGVQPGDVILSISQGLPYVIDSAAETQLTIANHPDFAHDNTGYSGSSTAELLTGDTGADGFEEFVILSQDVYIAGGEVTSTATEVFDFDPGSDEWPAATPVDFAFAVGQSMGEGRNGQTLEALSDFRLLLGGSRNLVNGRVTSLAGTASDFTDDTWAGVPLDPANESIDFPFSFRLRNKSIVIVHEHSARAFFTE
jgi:hypothetical protein